MLTLIVNVIVFAVVSIGGIFMMIFSLMDIWNYLMMVATALAALLADVLQRSHNCRRTEKIEIATKMLSFFRYISSLVEDHISVSLARQRSGWPSLPDITERVRAEVRKAEGLIKSFCEKYKLDFNKLFNTFLNDSHSAKICVKNAIDKLKLTEQEKAFIESRTRNY